MVEKQEDATKEKTRRQHTITTIAISPIPNRSSPPPWLLRSVFTGVATTTVTLVSSLFLSERVNPLSFSPTSWWSQREIVEKMIEMIDSGFDCGNVICARYDKTSFLGKQRQQVWTSSMTSQMITLGTLLWEKPQSSEFEQLARESEYAAWTLTNGYALNHITTISVHRLKSHPNKKKKKRRKRQEEEDDGTAMGGRPQLRALTQGVHDPSSDVRDPRAAPVRDLFLVHDSIRQLASDNQGVPDQATKDVRDPIEATRSIPARVPFASSSRLNSFGGPIQQSSKVKSPCSGSDSNYGDKAEQRRWRRQRIPIQTMVDDAVNPDSNSGSFFIPSDSIPEAPSLFSLSLGESKPAEFLADVLVYDQSCPVMELLTSSWEFLLSRVGHNLMVYLLQHTSIFLLFLGKQHQQVWTSSMYRAKRLKWEMAEKASSGGVGLIEESMLLYLVLWVLYLGKNLNLLNLSNWLGKVNVRHGRLPMAMHLTTSQSLSIGLNLIQTRRRRREERDRKKEMTELRWEGDRSFEL
ncbi:hypothetical protein F2Q69_00036578 [Brassica cretica]|uniref:2-oxoadipate dioxygenase/decarboxylase n=1 Tax=Brassica cretica TaxID=69181 RepID=A0A8S9ST23_BRACR|nr:hypothetical protein F2Q69_00036578 [Brassica cretica]